MDYSRFPFFRTRLLGVVLPILPTTPFVIVAVFCFAKSSKRLHQWLLSTKLYQNYVKRFNETRSMTLKSKIVILGFASSMLIAGFYFSKNIYARIIIILLICIKYYVGTGMSQKLVTFSTSPFSLILICDVFNKSFSLFFLYTMLH